MLIERPRRLRINEQIRSLVRETRLSTKELMYPIFVKDGKGIKEEIGAMPGQYRYSVDMLSEEIKAVQEAGVKWAVKSATRVSIGCRQSSYTSSRPLRFKSLNA